MKTRSQSIQDNKQLYNVIIDFDGASAAWRSNKKTIGNGNYKYICLVETCCKSCYKDLPYCWQHRKFKKE